jgi:hypothetical protein
MATYNWPDIKPLPQRTPMIDRNQIFDMFPLAKDIHFVVAQKISFLAIDSIFTGLDELRYLAAWMIEWA